MPQFGYAWVYLQVTAIESRELEHGICPDYTSMFAGLKSQGLYYCWLIYYERKILLSDRKNTAERKKEQARPRKECNFFLKKV